MPQIAYSGEQKFCKMLKTYGIEKSFPEIRAAIMRNIWSPEMESPSKVLQEVLDSASKPNGFEAESIDPFVGEFFGLYNELSQHQNADNPFRLYKVSNGTAQGIHERIKIRKKELTELLPFVKTTPASHELVKIEVADLRSILEKHLDELPDIPLSALEKMNKDDIQVMERFFDAFDAKLEGSLQNIAEILRLDRIRQIEKMKISSEFRSHVGRNDPCPCESGKKFKKCCLQ